VIYGTVYENLARKSMDDVVIVVGREKKIIRHLVRLSRWTIFPTGKYRVDVKQQWT
jgi:hypothetical protein